jgi:hypothetical protein
MADVYYNPEKFGLTLVGMADEAGLSYEFSMFGVWKDAGGQLYYGADSGCSCPSPFEDFTSLEALTMATAAEVHAALDEWAPDGEESRAEVASLHAKVAAL